METVCNNPANNNMIRPTYVAGLLDVPDSHPKVTLYSHRKAERDCYETNVKIYENKQKYSYTADKPFPTALKILLGLGAAFGVYKLIKFLIKKHG